jgi:monofunctional biosynthetic peptidoglycan transglycosylase
MHDSKLEDADQSHSAALTPMEEHAPTASPTPPARRERERERPAETVGLAEARFAAGTSVHPRLEPIDEPAPQKHWQPRIASWVPTLARLARYAALALAAWLALVVLLVALFRFVDPPGSMLMVTKRLGGTTITTSWRDLDDISPELARAVVASEDARFCEHWGIDLDEIANAIRRTRDGTPRGASTISMQVAKNLFLWPSKSYLRKALEVPVTLAIEILWPKRRILEVYLNIAEWGPGVFGAEAAARHHFAKAARRLSAREAALLAVTLPDPARRSAGKPTRLVTRLASLIERRAEALGSATRCLAP